MSFAGYEHALELLEEHRKTFRERLPEGCPVVDVHTHLGLDEDGMSLTLEQHLASMERNAVDTSFVFALNDPERFPAYRVPNDRVLAWAAESDGRLIPFVRLALDGDDPLAEAERCIDLGARGIKLHPRSQAFSVADPRFEAVFALAAERRIPVLIHAGRGLPPGLGEELAGVAARHPEASLILAHAAIADQGPIASFANGMPNVFFDTSRVRPVRHAQPARARSGRSRCCSRPTCRTATSSTTSSSASARCARRAATTTRSARSSAARRTA